MKHNAIVLTGGGTAGHVMPNLALLPDLRQSFSAIHYIGSAAGIERQLASGAKLPYHEITTVKLRRTLTLQNLKIPFLLRRGVREAKDVLSKIKPDVVFSKGGFVAVPVAFAAAKLGIPLVIHESDYTPGLANRLSAGKAVTVCTSFSETAARFPGKGVYTGTPIRPGLAGGSRVRGREALRFDRAKPVLLAMGGSQGSAALNRLIRECLPELTRRFNVVHLTGAGNALSALEDGSYRQIAFTTDLADLFAAADLVVSRAGSNAINELLFLAKPMLLIPLPKGESRGDQILNAAYFEKNGFARVLAQQDAAPPALIAAVLELYGNRERFREKMLAERGSEGVRNVLREILRAAGDQ